jgi:hypothetical protein
MEFYIKGSEMDALQLQHGLRLLWTKDFASAPPSGWWLIAKIVNHFMLTENITFEALQVESSVFPRQ